MSQLKDYRRETAHLISEARALLRHGFDLLHQQPPDAAALLTFLNTFTLHLDRLETDADIRYDNAGEKEMVMGWLRQQRDEAYHKHKTLARWLTQVQDELAQYQAQYPKPAPATPSVEPTPQPPTPRKASKKPIQQAFDFTEPRKDEPNE